MSELVRRGRSDRGKSRLEPAVEAQLRALLRPRDFVRPGASEVRRRLGEFCKRTGQSVPSRGTIYNAMSRLPPIVYPRESLPESVQHTLHNVGGTEIAGRHVVFAAFNHGDISAISYASALPWSCLLAAARLRGFRPKSLALLRAVMQRRGI